MSVQSATTTGNPGEGAIRRPDPAMMRPQPRRDGDDLWRTPACLCAALETHVVPLLPPGRIWEPADGDGALSAVLRAAGRVVIAGDRPMLDFLLDDPPAGRFGAIVFNPPFNELDRFLNRGLVLLDAGFTRSFVSLVRMDHLSSAGRVSVLNRASRIVAMNWRPFWKAERTHTPRFSFRWVVWLANHAGPPSTIFVQRPRADGREREGPDL